jgi:hypothetical protein
MSCANKRYEILTIPDPTKRPERKPSSTVAEINLLKSSITITNRKDDKESPCLKPRELLKKPECHSLKRKSAMKKYNALSKNVISPQNNTSSTSPLYMIISLLNIQLKEHSWLTRSNPTIQTFISNEHRINDFPISNKSILRLQNNLLDDHFQPTRTLALILLTPLNH